MARKKPKPKSPLLGRWLIVSMSNWDEDDINEEVQAFIEFEQGRRGEFHFGYVRGGIDYRELLRDGKPAVEFSWDGNDEMDPAQGRGWAVLDDNRLKGMIFFHTGDVVVARKGDALLADSLVCDRPSVYDLATILAHAPFVMRDRGKRR